MAKKTKAAAPSPETPPPATAVLDRMTMLLQFTHEHMGDQPHAINCVYSEMLETKEQPWSKRITVGEDWQGIPKQCWVDIDKMGLIILENLEGKYFAVNPTEKERVKIKHRVLEVALSDVTGVWLVPPGMPFIGRPQEPRFVKFRCQKGTADCRIHIIPR